MTSYARPVVCSRPTLAKLQRSLYCLLGQPFLFCKQAISTVYLSDADAQILLLLCDVRSLAFLGEQLLLKYRV
jgi:hypothetical protein